MKKFIASFIAFVLIFSICLSNLLPIRIVEAQNFDIVGGGDDIQGGSSVFVFRKSSKAPQTQSNSRGSGRSAREKQATRKSVVVKSQDFAKARPKPKPKPIDPESLAKLQKPKPKPTKPLPGKPKPQPTDPTDVPPTMTAAQAEALSNTFSSSADIYASKGNLDEAVRQYNKSLEMNPNNEAAKFGLSAVYVRRGDSAYDEGDYEKSLPLYQQAITLDAKNAGAFAGLGDTYEALGKKTEAQDAYGKALEINPQLSELNYPLGVLQFEKGDFAQAESNFSKSLAADPNNAEAHNYLGLSLARQNRQQEAIAEFNKATELDPNLADAFQNLGDMYDQLDRDQESAVNFQKAIALYETITPRPPRFAEAYYDLGVSLYNRGKYDEAAVVYEKARKANPVYYEALVNLADTYRQLKRYDEAIGIYAIAVIIGKEKPKAELADLYGRYGFAAGKAKKWNTAIEALRKSTELNSDAVDYTNLGWALNNAAFEKNQDKTLFAESRAALEKARQLDPNFYPASYNLGDAYNLTGEYNLAVETLTKTIDLYKKQNNKDWADAYVGRGFAYRGLGNLNKAADDLRQATKINGKMATAYFFLGLVENDRGNAKDAKKALEALQQMNSPLALRLDGILRKKVVDDLQRRGYKKVEEKNPVNKIPKPKLPF